MVNRETSKGRKDLPFGDHSGGAAEAAAAGMTGTSR